MKDYLQLPACPEGSAWLNVGKGVHCLVDIADLPMLAKYRWRIIRPSNRITYAITGNGSDSHPYMYMHRLIAQPQGDLQVDHINRNGLDNRRANLRVCNTMEQSFNKGLRSHSKNKYKGVHKRHIFASGAKPESVRFDVYIRHDRKKVHVGTFENEEEAARAYDKAAKEFHKEFACLNFPDED